MQAITDKDREASTSLPFPARANGTELTLRHRKFLKHLKAGKTQYQAARLAGYPHYMARKPKEKILGTSSVLREAITRWMEQEGLSDRALELV